jgi:hypothetical protein
MRDVYCVYHTGNDLRALVIDAPSLEVAIKRAESTLRLYGEDHQHFAVTPIKASEISKEDYKRVTCYGVKFYNADTFFQWKE